MLTNPNGSFKVSKQQAVANNRIKVGLRDQDYPRNMKFLKFYIKETSGEYYNMAMDRYYDAEDGNMWLAFPSSDRNKLDIDTFLILKKGVSSDTLVTEKARYKILAIENEAPDYIKTNRVVVSAETHKHIIEDTDPTSSTFGTFINNTDRLFGDTLDEVPVEGGVSFKMLWAAGFDNGTGRNLETILEKEAGEPGAELHVDFVNTINGETSARYKIAEITADRDPDDGTANHYFIRVEDTFGTDVNFMLDNPSQPNNATEIRDRIKARVWKYTVVNKPQFDGRFFVKIFVDEIFQKHIKAIFEGEIEYAELAQKKVYHMPNHNIYMERMKHIVGWAGGKSSESITGSDTHYTVGDTSALGRYMAYFQPMRMYTQVHHNSRAGGGHADTAYDAYSNPFTVGAQGYTRLLRTNYAGSSSFPYYTYKWSVPGRWYIDESTYYATRYNDDFYDEGWVDKPGGVNGSGVTNYNDQSRVHLSFGGITAGTKQYFDTDTVCVADITMSSNYSSVDGHNENINESYLDSGGSIHFSGDITYDTQSSTIRKVTTEPGSQGFFNITGSNSIYSNALAPNDRHEDQHNFAGKLNSGFRFRWENNPYGTVHEIVGSVDQAQLCRNPKAATNSAINHAPSSQGWGSTSTLDSNERISLYRPANFSKKFSYNVEPSMSVWDPTHSSNNLVPGPIPNGVKMGNNDNPVTFLEGREIKLTGTQRITQSQVGSNMNFKPYIRVDNITGFCDNSETPQVITQQQYLITNFNDATGAPDHDNLLVESIKEVGTNEYIIFITGYYKRLEQSDFPSSVGSTDEVTLRQACMNGLSPEAAESLNMDPAVQSNYKTIGSVGYNIQFVDEIFPDEILPEKPAIWETEPKETKDLDIYYEISKSIPLFLDDTTIRTIIENGSFVSTNDTTDANGVITNHLDPNTTVVNAYDNVIELSHSAVFDPVDPAVGLIPEQVFRIENADGTSFGVEAVEYLSVNVTYPNIDHIVLNPSLYNSNHRLNWHNCYSFNNGVESNRIRDNFNTPFISNGVRVSSTLEEKYEEERRKYGLIYSGLYNSVSGINNLNQFIAAEKITKDVNPIYGSIQKLFSRDTDLVTMCEDKVLRILADKDAVFEADGNAQLTSTNRVLGQTVPFVGEYGISKNPESFASESYRAYFSDKVRGAIIRLSRDGITPISDHGMKDWFRDNLKLTSTIHGSFDDKKDEYNITLRYPGTIKETAKKTNATVSFREDVKGWVSFKSFIKEHGDSCANNYYTFKNGKIYKHHAEDVDYNTFYGTHTDSSFITIFNDVPGSIKSFKTLDYEGTQSKVDVQLNVSGGVIDDGEYYNLDEKPGWYVESIETDQDVGSLNEFIKKEKKWFNYIKGKSLLVANYQAIDYDGENFAHQGLGTLAVDAYDTEVYGCMDPTMFNYNPNATINQVSAFNFTSDPCIPFVYGCIDSSAANYDPNANTDDGSCQYPGCTDGTYVNGCGVGCNGAINYDPNANVDDGSCVYCVLGCTDPTAFNYDAMATCDDGSCVPVIMGCTDNFNNNVVNYDPAANTDDGTCDYYGCMDSLADNFLLSGQDNGWNVTNPTTGENVLCWDNQNASNPSENIYPFSITLNYPYPGPTIDYLTNTNQNPNCTNCPISYIPPCATIDDGSCTYPPTAGCLDATACNYDPNATLADYCHYCADPTALFYDWADLNGFNASNCNSGCVDCPPITGVTITNVDHTGCTITWDVPDVQFLQNMSTSGGQINGTGIWRIKVHWGSPNFSPPYDPSSGQGGSTPVSGYIEYSPYDLTLNNGIYITDNGNGTHSIDVSFGAPGIVMGNNFIPNTTYVVAVDVMCQNDARSHPMAPINAPLQYSNNLQSTLDGAPQNSLPSFTIPTPPPPPVYGCTDTNAINYDCASGNVFGYTWPNPSSIMTQQPPCNDGVTVDDGSCIMPVYGCVDDGYCTDGVNPTGYGGSYHWCSNTSPHDSSNSYASPFNGIAADNYDPNANTDDGSCKYIGCTDPNACNYDPLYNEPCLDDNGVPNGTAGNGCCGGCGDPSAINYSGVTNYGCTGNCVMCPCLDNTTGAGAINDNLIVDPVYMTGAGATLDSNDGQTYMPITITFQFPSGFDFSLLNTVGSNYDIKLRYRNLSTMVLNTVQIPVPTSYNLTNSPFTVTFPAYNSSTNPVFSPQLNIGISYELDFYVGCPTDYNQYMTASACSGDTVFTLNSVI